MGAEDLRFGLNPGEYPAPVRRQLENTRDYHWRIELCRSVSVVELLKSCRNDEIGCDGMRNAGAEEAGA